MSLTSELSKPTLSPAAKNALRRVEILQVLHARTGIQTRHEQLETIMALENDDLSAVIAYLPRLHEERR